jgi:hypothetical protein
MPNRADDESKDGGVFEWHPDGNYQGKYRACTTIASNNKVMWFSRDGGTTKIGIKCRHGTMVVLDMVGGGYAATEENDWYKHSVTGGHNTFSLILEIVGKWVQI